VKIKHIAAAALLPATIAGLSLSAGAADAATAGHTPSHAAARQHRERPAQRWVTVRVGETLSGIAAAHHMSWKAIYATPPNMRTLRKPSYLRAGEHLRLPENPRFRGNQFRVKYAAELRPEFAAYEHDRARPARRHHPHQAAQDAQNTQAGQDAQAGPGAEAPQAATPQPLTAGMSSFEQCVAFRESTDTPTDPDGLFGILPSTWAELGYSGTAGQASVAQQKIAFNRLYAEYGAQPWAPSDGC
jgi:LysM domain-containing protein